LVEAESGFHLWSDTFDRQLEDVFAIQDEIAAAIAHELRTRLTNELDQPSTTVAMEAYELYLKGRSLVAARGEARLFEAFDILKAAIDIEPEYAPAMATLGKAYAVLPWFSFKIPAGEAREQARVWSSKALEIEPQNAEALATLAIVYGEVDMNWTGALQLLEKALQSNPGSVAANNFMGDLALRTGDIDNALKYESRAAELDPLGTVQLTDLSNVYMLKRDYRKAVDLAKRALALDPLFFSAHRQLIDAYYSLGDTEQLGHLANMIAEIPDVPADIPMEISNKLSLAHGDLEQAREALMRNTQLVKSGKADVTAATNLAVSLGDFDTAGELLMQVYREKDGTWIFPVWVRLPEQAPDNTPWSRPESASTRFW
jgi:tetratricopeptide (TPR) repeat protein